jgi:hypothetical protein
MIKPFGGSFPVTQTFDQHNAARIQNGWKYYNGGVDWGMPIGTELYACMDGMIELVQADTAGYGLNVRLSSGEYLIIYGHMSRFNVVMGARVKAGDLLGWSGNTGNSTGPHLHFEVRKKGVPVDPMLLIEPPKPIKFMEIIVPNIRIRTKPTLQGVHTSNLYAGTILAVFDTRVADGYIWGKIDGNHWSALGYENGEKFAEEYPL